MKTDTDNSNFETFGSAFEKAWADIEKQNMAELPPVDDAEGISAEEQLGYSKPKKENEDVPEPKQEPVDDEPDEQEGGGKEAEVKPGLPKLDEEEVEEAPELKKDEAEAAEPEKDSEGKPQDDEEDDDKDPYAHPLPKKRIERIRRKAAKEVEERLKTEYDRKIEELQAKLAEKESAQPKEVSLLTDAEREELLMLRRRIGAENDPEIKQQYDSKMEDNRLTIEDVMKQAFPAKEDQERLSRLGAFDEWASDPKNSNAAARILEALAEENPIQADIVRAKIAENISLKRGKMKAIEERSKSAKEWFETRTKQQAEQEEQQRKAFEEQRKMVKSKFDQGLKSYKSLQLVPTDGLDGKALEDAKAENKVRQQMQQFISDVRDEKYANIDDGINMVFAAAKAIKLQHDNARLQAKLKELEAKLNQRKEAGTVSRQSRATAPTVRREEKKVQTGDWKSQFDMLVAEQGRTA